MSIVRYTNKKNGTIYLYEQTKDPASGKLIRKYLGIQDPVSKQLIPSTKKRGRKPGFSPSGDGNNSNEYKMRYQEAVKALLAKDELIDDMNTKFTKLEATHSELVQGLTKLIHADMEKLTQLAK